MSILIPKNGISSVIQFPLMYPRFVKKHIETDNNGNVRVKFKETTTLFNGHSTYDYNIGSNVYTFANGFLTPKGKVTNEKNTQITNIIEIIYTPPKTVNEDQDFTMFPNQNQNLEPPKLLLLPAETNPVDSPLTTENQGNIIQQTANAVSNFVGSFFGSNTSTNTTNTENPTTTQTLYPNLIQTTLQNQITPTAPPEDDIPVERF